MAEATQIEGGVGWLGLAAALRSRDGHTVTGLGSPSRGNDGDENWSGLTAWAHDLGSRRQRRRRLGRGRGLMGLCSAVVSCYGAIAGGAGLRRLRLNTGWRQGTGSGGVWWFGAHGHGEFEVMVAGDGIGQRSSWCFGFLFGDFESRGCTGWLYRMIKGGEMVLS
ncbi:hypothetical protein M0R45_009107 [Rubus argutus]|uniref:Uncharacterized protein n=1 Tax=Rubus argutus TaxID=59490 RepID=A0AAW1Y2M1_RUBAR